MAANGETKEALSGEKKEATNGEKKEATNGEKKEALNVEKKEAANGEKKEAQLDDPPPPFLNALIGSFVVAVKAVELDVDLTGDQELINAWYPKRPGLPILSQIDMMLGILGIIGWIATTFFLMPKVIKTRAGIMGALQCTPSVVIPCMFASAFYIFGLTGGPGIVPKAGSMVTEIIQVRALCLFLVTTQLVAPIFCFRVAQGRKAAPPVPAVYQETRYYELSAWYFLLHLCLIDIGVDLSRDEALVAVWAKSRNALVMRVFFLGLLLLAGCLRMVQVLVFSLPKAMDGAPGRLFGFGSLLLAPAVLVTYFVPGSHGYRALFMLFASWLCAKEGALISEAASAAHGKKKE